MKKISLLLVLVATMFSCSLTSTEDVITTKSTLTYEQYKEKWVVIKNGKYVEENVDSFNESTAFIQSDGRVLFTFNNGSEPYEVVRGLKINGDTLQVNGNPTFHALDVLNGELIYSSTVDGGFFTSGFLRKYYKLKQ
jgi:hypothetical protein